MSHLDKIDYSEKTKEAAREFIDNNPALLEEVLQAASLMEAYTIGAKYHESAYAFLAQKGVPRGEGRRAIINELELRWSNRHSADKTQLN